MSLPIVFHVLAENELIEAAEYYASVRPGLGVAFIAAVERAVGSLAESPYAGTNVNGTIRWWLVRRFPYAVFYRVYDHQIRILAVGHQKRRPYHWRGRT